MSSNNPQSQPTAYDVLIAGIFHIIQEELTNVMERIDDPEASVSVEINKKVAALTTTYEHKLKDEIAIADQTRREKEEIKRREQREEADKVQNQLAKVQAEQVDCANSYKLLQERLAAAEAALQRVADERSRSDTEVTLAGQQVATPPLQPVSITNVPWSLATLETFTSGRKHRIANKQFDKWYATESKDRQKIHALERLDQRRQEWLIKKSGDYWTIKNAKYGEYMSLDTDGDIQPRGQAYSWDIEPVNNAEGEFRIRATGIYSGYGIALEEGERLERLDIYSGTMHPFEKMNWIIYVAP